MLKKTMIIDQENRARVAKLLGLSAPHLVPERFIYNQNWIIWWKEDGKSAMVIPHVLFKDKYNIVETREDCLICEKIK
jgi:hypothetical protein